MWVARNKDNSIRVFEYLPKRFHEGHSLSSKNVGFNDAIDIEDGKDCYSFWAIQKYYNSNELDEDSYGLRLFTYDKMNKKYIPYEPEVFKELSWEDEPIEVELTIKQK